MTRPFAAASEAVPAGPLARTRNVRIPFADPLPSEAGDVRLYRLCASGRNAVAFTARTEAGSRQGTAPTSSGGPGWGRP